MSEQPSSLTSKLQLALLQNTRRNRNKAAVREEGLRREELPADSLSVSFESVASTQSDSCFADHEYSQPRAQPSTSGSSAAGQQAILDYFAQLLNNQALEEESSYTLSDMLAYQVIHNELSGLIGLQPVFCGAFTLPVSGEQEVEELLAPDPVAGGAKTPPSFEVITEMLVACANAILVQERAVAGELVRRIRAFSSPFGCRLQRLAHYFVEALAAKLSGRAAQLFASRKEGMTTFDSQRAYEYVYIKCPYFALAHNYQNDLLLETFQGAERVHIIDYGIANGYQWPRFMLALASRPGGPPQLLRITGIDFPQPGPHSDRRVKVTGRRLGRYAAALGISFEYNAIASVWQDVPYSAFKLREDEVLAVSSIFRLRHVPEESAVATNPRGKVLRMIRNLNPKLFVLGVITWASNGPFIPRLREAIAHYENYFDVAASLMPPDNMHRLNVETHFFGRDILNAIACEGKDRIERPETYIQWHQRLVKAGLEQLPLTANQLSDAHDVLQKDGYHKHWGIGQDQGWMLMGWKDKVQHCLSVWKPSSQQ